MKEYVSHCPSEKRQRRVEAPGGKGRWRVLAGDVLYGLAETNAQVLVQVFEGDVVGGGERRWRRVVCRGRLPRARLKGLSLGFRVYQEQGFGGCGIRNDDKAGREDAQAAERHV